MRIEPRPSDGDQARPFDPAERPRTRSGKAPELPDGLGPLPEPSNDAMGFTMVEGPKGVTYAIASGTFSGGTADAFERFDELNQRTIDVVVFDSPGGLVLEATLKAAGWPADSGKLRAALESVKVDTKGLRGGPIEWSKDNHFRTRQYYRVYRWDAAKSGIVQAKDWVVYDVRAQ